MSRVWSFVKLDLRLVKAYYKSILIIIGMGIAMGIGFKSGATLSSYIMVMLALLMSYPFAVTDKNRLDTLYGTLTVSRKTVVVGRYLFVLLVTAAGMALSLLSAWLLTLAFRLPYVFTDSLFAVCLSTAFFLVVVAIQYPLFFRLGYAKARIWGLIPMIALFGIVLMVPVFGRLLGYELSLNDIFSGIQTFQAGIGLAVLGAGLVLLCLSCFLSYRLYRNKDI